MAGAANATLSSLLERLRAGEPPSSYDHLFDPDYARKLSLKIGGGDVPILDTREDAEPIEPVRRTRIAGVAP